MTTSDPPSRPSRAIALPHVVALQLASLLFVAGGVYVTTRSTADQVRDAAARLEVHVDAPGHAVGIERLTQVERRVAALEDSQRSELREMRTRLDHLDQNLVALCAAVRGAQCTRSP